MNDMKKLEELYAAKVKDRSTNKVSSESSPVFKLNEVQRTEANFAIQCCIR